MIGGPGVFGMFMDRYDVFWLSVAPHVRLPGGEPCFPGVPARSPQEILAAHGLRAGDVRMLDAAHDVTRHAVAAQRLKRQSFRTICLAVKPVSGQRSLDSTRARFQPEKKK